MVEGKAGERTCFQGPPHSWGLAPQRSDHQACSQGLSSQVRAVCRLHLPALQTHFQVSAALPVGKEASGVYQHHSGAPCWGHPAEGTWHLPWACHAGVTQLRAPGTSHGRAMLGSPSRGHLAPPMGPRRTVAGGALACEKPNRRAQLALVEGSKQPREAFASSCWAAPR